MARIVIARARNAVCTAHSPLEVRLEWRVGNGASIPDRPRARRLLAGSGGRKLLRIDRREVGTDLVEEVINPAAKRGRADGNGEGNEDDEHRVFGGRCPALVPTKAIEETKHERFLLQVRSGPMASARQRRSQCHSADTHLNRIPSMGCPVRRQKTVPPYNFIRFWRDCW